MVRNGGENLLSREAETMSDGFVEVKANIEIHYNSNRLGDVLSTIQTLRDLGAQAKIAFIPMREDAAVDLNRFYWSKTSMDVMLLAWLVLKVGARNTDGGFSAAYEDIAGFELNEHDERLSTSNIRARVSQVKRMARELRTDKFTPLLLLMKTIRSRNGVPSVKIPAEVIPALRQVLEERRDEFYEFCEKSSYELDL
jgi:hypothetical protein